MTALRVLVVTLLASSLAACEAGEVESPRPGEAEIGRVADGDSIVLAGGERVRLLQIDAPELGGGECHGREATRALERLLHAGDEVRLELDPELDEHDRHGRLLRYVHRGPDNVNVELVRRGAAAPFFLRGERGLYAEELLAALDDARSTGAGMWGSCDVRWRPDRQVETRPR